MKTEIKEFANGRRLVNEDGKVAVLYSPYYGAGWSTWMYSSDENRVKSLFCPEIALQILKIEETSDKKQKEYLFSELVILVEKIFPEDYCGGLRNLTIKWLNPNTLFLVREYDGYERIETKENTDYFIA